MSSAHAEHEQDGAVLNFAARLPPAVQRGQLVFGDGAVAEARGGRLLEGVLGEGEVRLANFETVTAGERGLCGFNVRVEVLVDEYVPDGSLPFALCREHAHQPEAALNLKNQIVAGCESERHK